MAPKYFHIFINDDVMAPSKRGSMSKVLNSTMRANEVKSDTSKFFQEARFSYTRRVDKQTNDNLQVLEVYFTISNLFDAHLKVNQT